MKLFITPGSPYSRMARMIVLEKQLEGRLEVEVAQTRTAGSPYYHINPSGRVPYLVRDDGVGMEESWLICRYLDHLEGKPAFDAPDGKPGWEALRLCALASSLMDGVAVLGRELRRPQSEQSPTIIQHEIARAARMTDLWEREIEHPWMQGVFNMAQMALVCALGLEARWPEFRWREGHPLMRGWFDRLSVRPSVAQTAPPMGQ